MQQNQINFIIETLVITKKKKNQNEFKRKIKKNVD